jgi:3-oxoacyl-[acyl-carrier-protein] synthase III
MVAIGWKWPSPFRATGPLTEKNYRNMFSDGAAAALLTSDSSWSIRGIGSATDGRFADYWSKQRLYREGVTGPDQLPNDLEVLYESVPLHRRALANCLQSASLRIDDIDHLILPLDPEPLAISIARHLRIPADKLVRHKKNSHVGSADPLFCMETLRASGRAEPGQKVLIGVRTVGIMRFLILEV